MAELREKLLTLSEDWSDPFSNDDEGKRKWEQDAKEFKIEAMRHVTKIDLPSHYASRTNAIVEPNIEKCAEYIRRFFQKHSGEIWLFDTDLGAFTHEGSFASLYRELILPHENIHEVKMLLRASFLDELLEPNSSSLEDIERNLTWNSTGYSDDVMARFGDKLQFRVMSAFPSDSYQNAILNQHRKGPALFDFDAICDSSDCRRSELGCYTSNESFIFYFHGRGDFASEGEAKDHACNKIAACVHRKLEDGTSTDLRVTITANKSFAKKESMEKFISQDQLKKFAILFNSKDRNMRWQPLKSKTWRPLRELLSTLRTIPAGTKVKEIDWNAL